METVFDDLLSARMDTIESAVDTDVARRWEHAADCTRLVIDTLLVTTALRHGLTLVTRNTIEVRGIDVAALDPFTSMCALRPFCRVDLR